MQVLVVGAGVVGLAVARAAAIAGHDVVVAEAASGIGTGVSSRNSEVIHAGLYYPTGSRRAYHCPRGRRMLYDFCASHGVPHRKCGKLVVATNADEIGRLEAVHKQARANGVEGVEIIDAAVAKRLKPAPGGGWDAALAGSEPQWLGFDAVVNCAGLGAQRLARATEGYPAECVPRLVLAKGNYFAFVGRPVFSRLIYPVPVPGGLGVHVTLDLAGRMRFGPDVEWIEREDYDVDPSHALAFYQRIRDYWPGLPDNSLAPDYCGIRPKLTGPGETAADFMIEGPAQHGLARIVHLFGIESPGLTCTLSIAEAVVSCLSD
jgi:L-2-hydroxyglutarate oxidase LhgO